MHKNHPNAKRAITLGIAIVGTLLITSTAPAQAQDALWRSYYLSAQKEYQAEDFVSARSFMNAALKVASNPDETLSTYYYLAHLCAKTGAMDEAANYYHFLLDQLGTKTWGVLRTPDGTPEWDQTASLTEQTSDGKRFLTLLNKRPPQLLTVRLAKPITIVDVLTDYANLLMAMRRYDDAEETFKRALSLSDCRPDQALNYEVKLLQRLCVLYDLQGRTVEENALKQRLAVERNAYVPNFDNEVNNTIHKLNRSNNSKALAIRLNNLALFCATHGDYVRAQSLFERSLGCMSDKPNRLRTERAKILNNYSDLLLAMGRASEATSMARQARLIELSMKKSGRTTREEDGMETPAADGSKRTAQRELKVKESTRIKIEEAPSAVPASSAIPPSKQSSRLPLQENSNRLSIEETSGL